jgi:hypothetical protein
MEAQLSASVKDGEVVILDMALVIIGVLVVCLAGLKDGG